MTGETRTLQAILADQFRLTAEVSARTGEYHRLLQKQGAAAFGRQMAEDGPAADLAEAEAAEHIARAAAEACDGEIKILEQQLAALGHELAALR